MVNQPTIKVLFFLKKQINNKNIDKSKKSNKTEKPNSTKIKLVGNF